jgi:hypothetical protein
MENLAILESERSFCVKNRIEDIILCLKRWSVCRKHAIRINSLEKRLHTTSCPKIILSSLLDKGGRYGLTDYDARLLNSMIASLLYLMHTADEIKSIFTRGLFQEYFPRVFCSKLYLTTPEVILSGINFGRFRISYNWKNNEFTYNCVNTPVYSYMDRFHFCRSQICHPLFYYLRDDLCMDIKEYLNASDFSLVEKLERLVGTISGKEIDFSEIIEYYWGPRICAYCSRNIKSKSDITKCIVCGRQICPNCLVLETWREFIEGCTKICDLCQDCAKNLMERPQWL